MAKKSGGVETIIIKKANPDKPEHDIDAGGRIQFKNSDPHYRTLTWQDKYGNAGAFWCPQPGDMPNGDNPIQTAQELARGKTLKYTFDGGRGPGGSGTVKVGS